MKKTVILALVLILVIVPIFAQGEKEKSSGNSAASGVEEIVFWDMNWGSDTTYIDAAKALTEKFNASQAKIQVTYQSIPWSNYYQVFLTAIKGGVGPDVATAGSQTPIQFAQMGEIQSLDSVVEAWKAEKNPILDDFATGALETNLFNGHYIALPWNADVRMWTYRTDYFAQAGITALPKTWNELLDILRILQKKYPDKYPLAIAGDMSGIQHLMNWLNISNATGIVSAEGKANFNTKAMQECLEFIATLYDEKLIPAASISYKWEDLDRLFLNDDCCIVFGPARPAFTEKPDFAKNIALLEPMRGPSATKPLTLYWANSIGVYSKAHTEASKVFLKWWEENNLPLWTEGHLLSLPLRKSYMENPYFQQNFFTNEITKKIAPTFAHATYPFPAFYPAFGQINGERYLAEAAQKVLNGSRNYATVLQEGQEETLDAIDMVAQAN
ncbi:sugar ABC transporter substrate-binding protein [uncultured Sphaerochaeta sp.]|uniref:ABC transporter substrate-binding protein n=1 Tax=uncultured Sphaerochaeta sp. TaxID=886478 RepID=UPI002A0A6174|nr:sugar ABC transporter substrate-binding protein [uncultured Sphaerochaeta sp.]